MRATLAILAALSGLSAPAAQAAPAGGTDAQPRLVEIIQPYVVQGADGFVDWFYGSAAAWGRTPVAPARGRPVSSDGLRLEASLRAKSRLENLLGGIPLDAERKLADAPGLLDEIPAIVERGYLRDERERRQNFHEVLWEVPFEGPSGLVPSIIAASRPGQPLPEAAAPVRPAVEGAPTGIVIDVTGLDAAPALFPRILDESGAEIASDSSGDPACHAAEGFAAYGWEMEIDPRAAERAGDSPGPGGPAARLGERPLRVRAVRAAGALKADIVVPESELSVLRSTPGAMDRLKACTLVILLDSPSSLLDSLAPPEPRRPSPDKKKRMPIEASESPDG